MRWIFFQKLLLHLLSNACAQEDAHGALRAGQQMKLFTFGHRGTSLATGQDNGLYMLRDSELRLQLGCCCQEGLDAWGYVIEQAKMVEPIHLLLDGTIDTRITGMQADYQFSTVVEVFHQGYLFFQIHGG